MVKDIEKIEKELKKLKEKKLKKIDKKIDKFLKQKLTSRKILKPGQLTMTIQKKEIEPYKPIYFKETLEQEKRSMFFD